MGKASAAALVAVALALPVIVPTASAVVGSPAAEEYRFTTRLDIGNGERACSGALVAPSWVLTASSCFVEDPAAGADAPVGKPQVAVTATVGRTDLTTSTGQVRDVVELVPYEGRDLMMARLGGAVTGITPVAISSSSAVPGDELRIPGYGRTATEWAPLRMHTGIFSVDAVTGGDVAVTGIDGAAVCAGDTGGPALGVSGSGVELVAVNSRSWQGGCFGTDEAETRTGAVGVRVDDARAWVEGIVRRDDWVDFDCDGLRDIAIGDPDTAVNGLSGAGTVRVIYGGDTPSTVITQDSSGVGETAEADDRFGFSLATYDRNQDGCTDLAVGVPYETRNDHRSAGLVQIIHGAPDGLLRGPTGTSYRQGAGTGALAAAVEESGDQVGFSLAAGSTEAGAPYLLIGAPGKNVGGDVDAGAAFYVTGGDVSTVITQSDPALTGASEPDDEFGYAVTANARHIAIGAPGETLSGVAGSGYVSVATHPVNGGAPTQVAALSQDSQGVSGVSEVGDRYGHSLDLARDRLQDAAVVSDSILAIGSPGDRVSALSAGILVSAGRAVTYRIAADGTWNELHEYHQGVAGVDGDPAGGDRFGEDVAVASTTADLETAASSDVLLAVGSPGDDAGAVNGSGSVSVFSATEPPAELQRLVHAGSGLPGEPHADEALGEVLTAVDGRLYIGVPDGPHAYGQVHAVPWSALVDTPTGDPLVTYEPGLGGLPAKGVSFGASIS